jgi:hypothetical protein
VPSDGDLEDDLAAPVVRRLDAHLAVDCVPAASTRPAAPVVGELHVRGEAARDLASVTVDRDRRAGPASDNLRRAANSRAEGGGGPRPAASAPAPTLATNVPCITQYPRVATRPYLNKIT